MTKRRLAFTGDTHATARLLAQAHDKAVSAGAEALIQVGDLGVYEHARPQFVRAAAKFTIPVYFIDGNHEDYRLMIGWQARGEPVEWVPGLTWLPRGYVMDLAGIRVGFLGGAASIDYKHRTAGVDWFPDQEQATMAQARRLGSLLDGERVDVLVTHSPPTWLITKYFPDVDKLQFGVGVDWRDPSSTVVEVAQILTGARRVICGHMHRSVSDESTMLSHHVTILDIGETLILDTVEADAPIEATEATGTDAS